MMRRKRRDCFGMLKNRVGVTGCDQLYRIIALPVPPSPGQAHTAGTPRQSSRGREKVSLSPCGIFAPCLLLQGLWFTLIAPALPSSRRTTSRSTTWFRTYDTRCSVVKIQCRKCVPSLLRTFLRGKLRVISNIFQNFLQMGQTLLDALMNCMPADPFCPCDFLFAHSQEVVGIDTFRLFVRKL